MCSEQPVLSAWAIMNRLFGYHSKLSRGSFQFSIETKVNRSLVGRQGGNPHWWSLGSLWLSVNANSFSDRTVSIVLGITDGRNWMMFIRSVTTTTFVKRKRQCFHEVRTRKIPLISLNIFKTFSRMHVRPFAYATVASWTPSCISNQASSEGLAHPTAITLFTTHLPPATSNKINSN